MERKPALLSLRDLCVDFQVGAEFLRAVRHLNLDIGAGTITSLAGESGCGKSLTCRAIQRLAPENATLGGSVDFRTRDGACLDLLGLPEANLRQIRGRDIGMIFQEPMTSLNPVLTVGQQTAEPLRTHLGMSRKEAKARVIELFQQVGIPAAASRCAAYPHQLSGGMRQRVMIAMALACGPSLLLADEPTTALDATIQGQILRLIREECLSRGMAVLLITHDLGVVAEVADFAGVMYAGMLMERADVAELFANPLHPYTKGLMASQPGAASIRLKRLPTIPGSVPTLDSMPIGCPFQPRCAEAMPICVMEIPPEIEENGHMARCWLYDAGRTRL